jgi:sigma-B regulation protein RsbU (phosphoserine phosphatase)
MAATYSILLIGMAPAVDQLARQHFQAGAHLVTSVPDVATARQHFSETGLDVVYLQPAEPRDAIKELQQILEIRPDLAVVLVATPLHPSFPLEAWRSGAAEMIEPPLTASSLDTSLKRAARRFPPHKHERPAKSESSLRYMDELGRECRAAISSSRFTIGRSASNDLTLTETSVSRMHTEIVEHEGEFFLRDLESKHGTFINGVRVDQARLNSGDRIQLGGAQGVTLTFDAGDLLYALLGPSEVSGPQGLSIQGFREMGILLHTLRSLSSIRLLDDLLALVVDTAIALSQAERGFIMLKEADNTLNFRCARNRQKRDLSGSSFQISQRVPEEAFQKGKRVVIQDLDLGDHAIEHSKTLRLGLRSIICVPLQYRPHHEFGTAAAIEQVETVGVLYVDSQTISTGFSEAKADALETLASEAAMAIYNARLYRDFQEKQKLEEELNIAKEIQQALLPAPTRILSFASAYSHNVPCHEVGGDYFDYFDMPGGRFGFAVGDVSGKGMPAALLASVLQGMFSATTPLDLPIPTIISSVNRNLTRRGTGNRFVTFFFGMIDADGTLTYTNAGHNPPYVVGRDGSIQPLTEGGMVLGLFASAQYESRTIQLRSGDHVVLFTDGVLEALNTMEEEFGEERLLEILRTNYAASSSAILDCIREAVTVFSANTPQHDDITMMVVGYKE